MDRHLHCWEKAALTALCLTLLLACRVQGEREAYAENTLRLHVIAASDAPEEQAQKLLVRDAVLRYLTPLLKGAKSRSESEARLFANLGTLAETAAAAAGGRQVTVTLGPAHYESRTGDGYALPAGRYESLRVILGAGEGHNWWGLLFPELTLPAAEGEPVRETLAAEDRAEEQAPVLRFFLLEVWDALVNRLQ